MNASDDLRQLLSRLAPVLDAGTYVFATLPDGEEIPADLLPRMCLQEQEGTTIIITETAAKAAGLAYAFPCRMITLNVYSELASVGLMAKVAARLASLGIAVNPVAGYFHDHLFVPAARAEAAMIALHQLTDEARA